MRIDPSGGFPPVSRPQPNTSAGSCKDCGPAGAGAVPAQDAGGFAPTADLARLLEAVKQTPEVRANVIESVAARLAAGEFDSPQAASDAARTMLGGGE